MHTLSGLGVVARSARLLGLDVEVVVGVGVLETCWRNKLRVVTVVVFELVVNQTAQKLLLVLVAGVHRLNLPPRLP